MYQKQFYKLFGASKLVLYPYIKAFRVLIHNYRIYVAYIACMQIIDELYLYS